MRDPNARNPHQQSIYIHPADWEAVRALAAKKGTTMSGVIVRLVQRERDKVLGKSWKPEKP